MTVRESTQASETGMASSFYHTAELLQVPFYFLNNEIVARWWTVLTPGQFGNFNNRIFEIYYRGVVLGLGALVTLWPAGLGYALSIGCNYLGDYLLGNQPYLRLHGAYVGEKRKAFATFNMSTLLPTMTRTDGVAYSSQRLKGIAEKVKDFHFVCGQEVDGVSARFFSHELKDNFTEFYTYIGKLRCHDAPGGREWRAAC